MNYIIFDGNKTQPLIPTIVCRDFNIDLLTCNYNLPIQQYFDHISLKSKLPHDAITMGYTQIDNIFSNIEKNAGTYSALFSYHKP